MPACLRRDINFADALDLSIPAIRVLKIFGLWNPDTVFATLASPLDMTLALDEVPTSQYHLEGVLYAVVFDVSIIINPGV